MSIQGSTSPLRPNIGCYIGNIIIIIIYAVSGILRMEAGWGGVNSGFRGPGSIYIIKRIGECVNDIPWSAAVRIWVASSVLPFLSITSVAVPCLSCGGYMSQLMSCKTLCIGH